MIVPKLRVKDVATMLSVSVSTIYRWMNNDGFPHTRIGGGYRFEQDKIDKWLKENQGFSMKEIERAACTHVALMRLKRSC